MGGVVGRFALWLSVNLGLLTFIWLRLSASVIPIIGYVIVEVDHRKKAMTLHNPGDNKT